jgi:hypothetical protein
MTKAQRHDSLIRPRDPDGAAAAERDLDRHGGSIPRPAAWLYAALFAIGLVAYGVAAWDRLGHPSRAPHFVYQADAWLHGRVSIAPACTVCAADGPCDPAPRPREWPYPGEDWAQVETVELTSGAQARGRRLLTRPFFRTLAGTELPLAEIRRTVARTTYVSFPAFPSVIMLPGAMMAGRAANDVIPTLFAAALILPLTLAVLRRLVEAGLSRRTIGDDLWLVAALAFGTVMFFCAVQGKVWFTAHVVGVVLALIYAWASIEAAHPAIAGSALAAAALTRAPMALMFPLIVFEAWRVAAGGVTPARVRRFCRFLVPFAIPLVVLAAISMAYNDVRFAAPLEFGHSYLAFGNGQPVGQQVQIEQFGLFSLHYLERNLAAAFALTPALLAAPPWVQVSGHGLAIWATTPILLTLLIRPGSKNPLRRALWVTIGCVAIPSLHYMNTGWVQFGYRFALDYLVFAVMLLAIGDCRFGIAAKVSIVVGVLINLFGAITFDRMWDYYRLAGDAYDLVARDVDRRLAAVAIVLAGAALVSWRARRRALGRSQAAPGTSGLRADGRNRDRR